MVGIMRYGKSTIKLNKRKVKWTLTILKKKIIHPPPLVGNKLMDPSELEWQWPVSSKLRIYPGNEVRKYHPETGKSIYPGNEVRKYHPEAGEGNLPMQRREEIPP